MLRILSVEQQIMVLPFCPLDASRSIHLHSWATYVAWNQPTDDLVSHVRCHRFPLRSNHPVSRLLSGLSDERHESWRMKAWEVSGRVTKERDAITTQTIMDYAILRVSYAVE